MLHVKANDVVMICVDLDSFALGSDIGTYMLF